MACLTVAETTARKRRVKRERPYKKTTPPQRQSDYPEYKQRSEDISRYIFLPKVKMCCNKSEMNNGEIKKR
ncbi:hypothetical protein PMAC_001860 [Pneumocystis sp. 'macacae']|nr:hypothetical protein PMAC_001860 [Pneumocystis sp. 'macacae']